jgi:hypothetical protein
VKVIEVLEVFEDFGIKRRRTMKTDSARQVRSQLGSRKADIHMCY